VIIFAYGQIAINAHIRVPNISNISTEAKRLFFNPNCIGVKAKLKIKFKIKGNKTINGILPFEKSTPAYTKVIAIIAYRIDHTGPNNQLGGAHVGLIKF
jgi:hypothetical protein